MHDFKQTRGEFKQSGEILTRRHLATGGLPRRDYFLLPLVCLLTTLVLVGGAEVAARLAYPDEETDACLLHDPDLGVRFKPNCDSHIKLPETEWTSNHFNSCGYRSTEACGPKPANTLRIALLGSSIGFGLYVPYEQSIGAVLAKDLTDACGRPVEVQNLASEFEFWDVLYKRFRLALDLRPDLIVVVAGPTDIMYSNDAIDAQVAKPKADLLSRIRDVFADLRLRIVAQHLMYSDANFYLSLYRNSLAKTIYMRDELPPYVTAHLKAYGDVLAKFPGQVDGKAVPLLLAYVPQRAQVGFVSDPARPAGIDPFALDRALGEVAAKDNLAYVDTTRDFAADPRQMDLFLRSDGHMTKEGDEVAGHSIARVIRQFAPFQSCVARGS